MPIIKSAAKRMRQNSKRATVNAKYKRAMRTATKQALEDIESKKKSASASLAAAQKAIDKAAKKGIIHRNTASRRKSRLGRLYSETFDAKSTKTATSKSSPKKTAVKPTTAKPKPKTTSKKPSASKKTAKKSPAKK